MFMRGATESLEKRQVNEDDGWSSVSQDIRDIGRKTLGMTSGKRKPEKETWWRNEDVQKAIEGKKQAKKAKD